MIKKTENQKTETFKKLLSLQDNKKLRYVSVNELKPVCSQ